MSTDCYRIELLQTAMIVCTRGPAVGRGLVFGVDAQRHVGYMPS
jgi:hypothetical protein